MPKSKGKRESISLIDVLTHSDKFVRVISKRTKRSPMTNALLMYQMSESPLVSAEAKKRAKEDATSSAWKVAGKIVNNALKDTYGEPS